MSGRELNVIAADFVLLFVAAAVLRWRASRVRCQIASAAHPAELLWQFRNFSSWVVIGTMAVAAVRALWPDREHPVAPWFPVAGFIGTAWGAAMVASWIRLGLERPLRPAGWSRRRAMWASQIGLVLLVGGFGLVLGGEAVINVIARRSGIGLPDGFGGAWAVVVVAGLWLLPSWRLLGPITPATVLAERLKARAGGQEVPEVGLVHTGSAMIPNALARWRPGRSSILATDALVDRLEPDEVDAVLLHELAHVRFGHPRLYWMLATAWQTLGTAVLALWGEATAGMSLMLVCGYYLLVFPRLSRRCEIACDRFAAERCGAELFGRALRKLHEAALLPVRFGDKERMTHPSLARRLSAIGASGPQEAVGPQCGAPLRWWSLLKAMLNLIASIVLLFLAAMLLIFHSISMGMDPAGSAPPDPLAGPRGPVLALAVLWTWCTYAGATKLARYVVYRRTGRTGGRIGAWAVAAILTLGLGMAACLLRAPAAAVFVGMGPVYLLIVTAMRCCCRGIAKPATTVEAEKAAAR